MRRKLIIAAIVLPLLALVAWHYFGPDGYPPLTPPTNPAHAAALPANIPGIDNFSQVSPDLYRGEQPTAQGMAELKKRGIKTVVNLRDFHSDRAYLKGTGLNYAHLNCDAWAPNEQKVVQFLKIMSDSANRPVFIHCAQGSDRTGMMCAAYRMVEQGWTNDEAMNELRNFGFHAVWRDIQNTLRKFDAARIKAAVAAAAPVKVEPID